MKDTLIALMGNHNQGKTETLTALVRNLLAITGAKHSLHNTAPDITDDLIEIGGVKIGILDSDYPYSMVNTIDMYMTTHMSNIIVCRTGYIQRYTIVNDHIDNAVVKAGYRVFRTTNYSIPDKTPQPLHGVLNRHTAEQIAGTIQKIMSGAI